MASSNLSRACIYLVSLPIEMYVLIVSPSLIRALPGSSSASLSGSSSSVGKDMSSSNHWRKASVSSMLESNAF
jgi:hypothetical protein